MLTLLKLSTPRRGPSKGVTTYLNNQLCRISSKQRAPQHMFRLLTHVVPDISSVLYFMVSALREPIDANTA